QGGTLVCAALPEAASDLVRLAGMGAEAVVCAVLGLSGNLASAAELDALATRHGLPRVSISEVIQMRLRSDTLVRRVAEAMLPLRDGPTFRAIVYDNSVDQHQHMALVLGDVQGDAEVLVRLHSECLTRDGLGSARAARGGAAPGQHRVPPYQAGQARTPPLRAPAHQLSVSTRAAPPAGHPERRRAAHRRRARALQPERDRPPAGRRARRARAPRG